MDIIYIAIAGVFFLSCWGLMKLCELSEDHPQGGKS
jgi:hypothetical protein